MNKRTLSTIKGFVWTAFALLLWCALNYALSVFYPHRFPRTWATRDFILLPLYVGLFGAWYGWIKFEASTQEKKEDVFLVMAFALSHALMFSFWRWVFGFPLGEESEFVIKMLSTLTTFPIVLVWLLYRVRLDKRKAQPSSLKSDNKTHHELTP